MKKFKHKKTKKGEKVMKYQNRKDPSKIAEVVKEEPKYNTLILKILQGDGEGKQISITTSTLKRYWKRIEETESAEETSLAQEMNIDMAKVNEPYPEPKEKKYIPKPQSVVEYEAKQAKRYNSLVPEFSDIADTFSEILKKVNENSKYVMFKDGSTLWRKSGWLDMYVTEAVWTKLTELGFESKPNKDKDRPYAFRITSAEEYEKIVEALKCMTL